MREQCLFYLMANKQAGMRSVYLSLHKRAFYAGKNKMNGTYDKTICHGRQCAGWKGVHVQNSL